MRPRGRPLPTSPPSRPPPPPPPRAAAALTLATLARPGGGRAQHGGKGGGKGHHHQGSPGEGPARAGGKDGGRLPMEWEKLSIWVELLQLVHTMVHFLLLNWMVMRGETGTFLNRELVFVTFLMAGRRALLRCVDWVSDYIDGLVGGDGHASLTVLSSVYYALMGMVYWCFMLACLERLYHHAPLSCFVAMGAVVLAQIQSVVIQYDIERDNSGMGALKADLAATMRHFKSGRKEKSTKQALEFQDGVRGRLMAPPLKILYTAFMDLVMHVALCTALPLFFCHHPDRDEADRVAFYVPWRQVVASSLVACTGCTALQFLHLMATGGRNLHMWSHVLGKWISLPPGADKKTDKFPEWHPGQIPYPSGKIVRYRGHLHIAMGHQNVCAPGDVMSELIFQLPEDFRAYCEVVLVVLLLHVTGLVGLLTVSNYWLFHLPALGPLLLNAAVFLTTVRKVSATTSPKAKAS